MPVRPRCAPLPHISNDCGRYRGWALPCRTARHPPYRHVVVTTQVTSRAVSDIHLPSVVPAQEAAARGVGYRRMGTEVTGVADAAVVAGGCRSRSGRVLSAENAHRCGATHGMRES